MPSVTAGCARVWDFAGRSESHEPWRRDRSCSRLTPGILRLRPAGQRAISSETQTSMLGLCDRSGRRSWASRSALASATSRPPKSCRSRRSRNQRGLVARWAGSCESSPPTLSASSTATRQPIARAWPWATANASASGASRARLRHEAASKESRMNNVMKLSQCAGERRAGASDVQDGADAAARSASSGHVRPRVGRRP